MSPMQIFVLCLILLGMTFLFMMGAFFIARAYPAPSRAVGQEFCKPDGRGWVGIACYVLVVTLLAMIFFDRSLLKDEYFKVLGTAIVLSGWSNGVVSWAYSSTKSGGELADNNAKIVSDKMAASDPKTEPGPHELGPWAVTTLAEIANCKTLDELDEIEKRNAPGMAAAPPSIAKSLHEGFDSRRKELAAG